ENSAAPRSELRDICVGALLGAVDPIMRRSHRPTN
ncbi:MAG: hypothetical protein JWN99_2163, partial [Ilumatobacteraceae bacterium]|nr:hypothetical protein [Ilumatobacteraceae bacterium]